MRILSETIQQTRELTLVPLLERKKKCQGLPGQDWLEWLGLSHGAAWKDRSTASSSRRPSPSSSVMSRFDRQATRASVAADTLPLRDAPLRSGARAFVSDPTS